MERREKPLDDDQIMDIADAADYLRITKWSLYRLVRRGKVPAIKVGGQWRFRKKVLDETFDRNAE